MSISGVSIDKDVPARMRDGVTLYSDVYRPSNGEGPWPVILIRQPYGKTHAETFTYLHPSWYARQGYLVVSQDVRGRWASEGDFYPFRHEMDDGYDTVEWAAGLPGSDGKVGMYGFSYGGITQLLAAAARPPHLACICPAFAGSQMYEGWAYNGGAFALSFNLTWAMYLATDTARRRGLCSYEATLWKALGSMHDWWQWLPMDGFPLLKAHDLAPYFFDWIDHPDYDHYWKQWSIDRFYTRIAVPGLHIGGWYDIFRDGVLRNYLGISQHGMGDTARNSQRLLMGPWYHSPWAQVLCQTDLGDNAKNLVDLRQIRWFDYWLKGQVNGVMDEPRVSFFMLGDNSRRTASQWPPPGSPVALYLHSGGRANSLNGDGTLSLAAPGDELPDLFVYNPRAFVPSLGGQSCCMTGITPMGPADQRLVEAMNQVLVYTTAPLEQPLAIAGPVSATLWASTDVPDTDFTVKLVDVSPDGTAINLTSGILRAKYRESPERPVPLDAGTIYSLAIDAGSTAAVFGSGHCIRVEIASSCFPCWDRNTNSGRNPMKDNYGDMRMATQQVFHDRSRPSCITMHVLEQ